MSRQVFMVLGIASLALPAMAIAATDFSGSWVRDNAKSNAPPSPLYWLTRSTDTGGRGGRGGAGGGRGRGGAVEPVMTVHQDANNLQVTDPQGSITKYTLDGKPHTRPTETGIQKAIVTASLQGDTVLIGISQPYGGMPGNATLDIKEIWSLSPDGKTLTITTTHTVPAAQKTFQQVFYRK